MSIRTERVASVIKEELGGLITREYRDRTSAFITVTDVRMTPDLRIARVAVSVFGPAEVKEQAMEMLVEETPHLRQRIGKVLQLRFTPAIEFVLDDTLDRVDRINSLIRKIHDQSGSGSDQRKE